MAGPVEPVTTDTYEVELKLQPLESKTLDDVWDLERIADFEVVSRHHLQLRSQYFDSTDNALDRAGGNLRWRTIAGAGEAELTYKGPSQVNNGVFRRLEITALLPANVDPLSVQPTPRPVELARRITEELRATQLVLDDDRRGMRLVGHGATVEVDLDISTMPGTTYLDLEIEAEMVDGNPSVLADLEAALATVGPVKRSTKGKRARAWDFVRHSRHAE
ncbi:MAG TPA: CYTH domain-containing protein [Chloroflexota bacterium]|jgi:inorganic triphosphatase YgiF|nr:CYTH domain-containing protein [Chloroflexota bacterium]